MTKSLIVCSLAVISLINFGDAQNYCNLNKCQGNSHTMCQYRSNNAGSKCGRVLSAGLSENEKRTIVNVHNQLRQKVANGREGRGLPGPQPAAKNMQNLQWDNELATIAQRWANQCDFNHDKCRNVERYSVGQNIAYVGTTGDVNTLKVESMVNNWYNEVKDYSKNSVSKFTSLKGPNGKDVGHYTQLVWAKTNRVGCGAMRYNDGRFNKFFLVCNYGPTGNYQGQPVYERR
ncbi:venom allergen 3-like [Trichogramma pretiosum]|uniref:venom allergen 3-like n=1 Tax=Trichogramma pretiosum TaxID=7493 RepID=UPI0006C94E50|nr:venom allergen 3-like [Trichogramma pretiosum]